MKVLNPNLKYFLRPPSISRFRQWRFVTLCTVHYYIYNGLHRNRLYSLIINLRYDIPWQAFFRERDVKENSQGPLFSVHPDSWKNDHWEQFGTKMFLNIATLNIYILNADLKLQCCQIINIFRLRIFFPSVILCESEYTNSFRAVGLKKTLENLSQDRQA